MTISNDEYLIVNSLCCDDETNINDVCRRCKYFYDNCRKNRFLDRYFQVSYLGVLEDFWLHRQDLSQDESYQKSSHLSAPKVSQTSITNRLVVLKFWYMRVLKNIKGFLFDLDGVIYVGDQAVPGAVETIKRMKQEGIPIRFVTNTSASPLSAVMAKLKQLGVPAEPSEVFTATVAARTYLKQQNLHNCLAVLNPEVAEEFADYLAPDDESVEAVLIGEIGDRWDYPLLNRIFHMVLNGAQLIALHKGRFWKVPQGLRLGIGGFVAALEYATGTEAMVIGKPMPSFFELGVASLGLQKGEVAMVGDDIDSDVGGAQACGLLGVLARSGKYNENYVRKSSICPDLIIDGIKDLPSLMNHH